MSVYFIQAGNDGLIKIGHARSVTKRLAALQTGSAHDLKVIYEMRGGLLEEQGLHAAFKTHRVQGEWFRPHSDIFNWIAKFKGEKRPTSPAPSNFTGAQARAFTNKILKFMAEVMNEESEDGIAARRIIKGFVERDEEMSAYVAAQKQQQSEPPTC